MTGLMTPGSLLLGNPGECFEGGHEHAAGAEFGVNPRAYRIEAQGRLRG